MPPGALDGGFDLAWLDEAIELFEERGIEVVLCTPTSSPPMWMYEKQPDIVYVEKGGRRSPTWASEANAV